MGHPYQSFVRRCFSSHRSVSVLFSGWTGSAHFTSVTNDYFHDFNFDRTVIILTICYFYMDNNTQNKIKNQVSPCPSRYKTSLIKTYLMPLDIILNVLYVRSSHKEKYRMSHTIVSRNMPFSCSNHFNLSSSYVWK
jgi:hypothetical protein